MGGQTSSDFDQFGYFLLSEWSKYKCTNWVVQWWLYLNALAFLRNCSAWDFALGGWGTWLSDTFVIMQVVVPGSRRHSYLDMSGAHSSTLPHHFFHLFDDLYLLKFCVGRISYILISWKRLMALLKDGFPNLVIFSPESYPLWNLTTLSVTLPLDFYSY